MPDVINALSDSQTTPLSRSTGSRYNPTGVNIHGKNTMDISDFYKLLATQFRYQDADNPMDTSQMMNQMVQTQMIQSITQMSQMNLINYTTSMIGQEVTVVELDPITGLVTEEETTGVVTGALISGSDPRIFIGDKAYYVSQVMIVGKAPAKVEDPEDPDEPGNSEDPEGPEGPQDPENPDGPQDPEGPQEPGEGGSDGTGGTDGTGGSDGTGGTDGTGGSDGTGGTDGTGGSDGTGGTDGSDGTGDDAGV